MTAIAKPYPLFAVYGIEIEYMIVDRGNLTILPVTDQVLKLASGDYVSDFEAGPIAWSNELVLHAMELKTNGPVASLAGLPGQFMDSIRHVNKLLRDLNGMLMPTGMHPWMDPRNETRLWPHEFAEIYAAFNRIFDCRSHGWSNLQSVHVNLPFASDAEFAQLHSAIRVLMPIMPAIAASSPIRAGQYTGVMDNRLESYRRNSEKIPCITGQVIPEPVQTREEYQARILDPIYRSIAPLDPTGTLQHEWLNARGAIARFERNAIEIRILDTQESPLADIAVAALITGALKLLVADIWSTLAQQLAMTTDNLAHLLLDNAKNAEQAVIRDREFLRLFAFPDKHCEAGELWLHILETIMVEEPGHLGDIMAVVQYLLREGTLARRICRAVGGEMRKSRLEETYRQLCKCLATGELFTGIE